VSATSSTVIGFFPRVRFAKYCKRCSTLPGHGTNPLFLGLFFRGSSWFSSADAQFVCTELVLPNLTAPQLLTLRFLTWNLVLLRHEVSAWPIV
jgi:hypothetical protein